LQKVFSLTYRPTVQHSDWLYNYNRNRTGREEKRREEKRREKRIEENRTEENRRE